MFRVKCPNCGQHIRKKMIKDNFRCPSCNAALVSNRNKARLIMIGICLAALPVVLGFTPKIAKSVFGPDADPLDQQMVGFTLYVLLIMVVWPWLLQVKIGK